MSEIDKFSIQLFEQAKRFLEKSKIEDTDDGKKAYLHAALLIGISSLEAHVNAIAEEILDTRQNLDILERSLLSEKEYIFKNGYFVLTDKLKMYRLLERIEFIFNKFSTKQTLDKGELWWSQLVETLRIRNDLVHPKVSLEINEKTVTGVLEGILEALDTIYKALFNARYPAVGRRLDSKLTF